MSTFIFDCPNCSAKKSTFDVNGSEPKGVTVYTYNDWYLFSTCRSCNVSICINARVTYSTSLSLESKYGNNANLRIQALREFLSKGCSIESGFVDFKYSPILPSTELPPEYLPDEVESLFKEAAKCYAISCYNASGAMFRLCLDITTKNIISQYASLNPTTNDKKTIHSRLNWIFNNNILPKQLEELSRCIKDDGNDAAHDGSLSKDDAADLLDFTYILLERIYTEPARIQNAHQRRVERRQV